MARPIDIILRGRDEGASAAVRRVTSGLKSMGDEAAKSTKRARDELGRFTKGADDAGRSVGNLGKSVERMDKTMAFQNLSNQAGQFANRMGDISSGLIQVYREGARADAKLSAMLKKRGEGGRLEEMSNWAGKLARDAALIDDDPIKEASAGLLGFGLNAKQIQEIMPGLIGQSRLYGQSLDSVSMAFGKAFASGNAGALKRSGVTLSPDEIDRIKAATEGVQRQAVMFEIVKSSMDRYALSMTEGMSESEIAANRMALSIDQMQSNMGEGAATSKQNVDNLFASLIGLSNASPEVQKSAGSLMFYVGAAGQAGGSIVELGAQIGMMASGLEAAGISGSAAFTAIKAGAMTALPWVLAIGAGIAIGAAIGNSQGWKRITNLPAYNAKWAELNKRMNDPNLSKDVKARTLEEAAGDFAGTGLTDDVETVKAKYKELTGKDMADPAMAKMNKATDDMMAKMKAIMPSAAAAPSMGSPISTGAAMGTDTAATATGESAILSLKDQIANTPKGAAKKQLQAQLRAVQANLRFQKAQEAADKKAGREREKALKKIQAGVDAESDLDADIAIAQLQADTEFRIKQLEAMGATPQQIADVKAGAVMQEAQLRARGLKGADAVGRQRVLKLGEIEATQTRRMAMFEKGGKSGVNLSSFLGRGGSVFDLPSEGASSGGGGGAMSLGGAGGGGGTRDVRIKNQVQPAVNGWWIRFTADPIFIPNVLSQAGASLPFSPGAGLGI